MRPAWLLLPVTLLAVPVTAQDTPGDVLGAEELADRFEYALVAGDYRMLPVTEDFIYIENGAQLDPWDGMWQTTTALEGAELFPELDYRVEFDFGDTVIRLVESDENGTKGVLAYRLIAQDGAIVRVDTLPIREEFTGARSGTVSLMQPMIPNTMDGERVGPADPQLTESASGLEVDFINERMATVLHFMSPEGTRADETRPSVMRLIAADCVRSDNGVQVTNVADSPILDPEQPSFRPYALGCRDQVLSNFYSNLKEGPVDLYADPERSIGIAFVRFDQPGTVLSFEAQGVGTVNYPGPRGAPAEVSSEQFDGQITENMITPLSMNGVFVFKFDAEGRIKRIDAFYRGAPYKWSGWDFGDE